jgi:NAD(P)-dependent dehydrogenase (short-subunit alcohol dehydrogenase family)
MTTVSRTLGGAFIAGLFAAGVLTRRNRRAATVAFRGKVVFITGSSRGLGLALAKEFLRRGARVVISARNSEELAQAYRQLEKLASISKGADIMQIVCDVTEPTSVQKALDAVHDSFGPIDVLVNNAGIMAVAPVLNQSVKRFEEAMNTNFYGATLQSRRPQDNAGARRWGNHQHRFDRPPHIGTSYVAVYGE